MAGPHLRNQGSEGIVSHRLNPFHYPNLKASRREGDEEGDEEGDGEGEGQVTGSIWPERVER